jgi:tRNA (guanosine-2'-O-)-methyltransferase
MAAEEALSSHPVAASSDDIEPAPDRLRRAEKILQNRTDRFAVVLERITDTHNESAVIRSAEAMGIQNIFLVEPIVPRNEKNKPVMDFARSITKSCTRWLTIRKYPTTAECLEVLKSEGYSVWATDLSREAVSLDDRQSLLPVPEKVGNHSILVWHLSDKSLTRRARVGGVFVCFFRSPW